MTQKIIYNCDNCGVEFKEENKIQFIMCKRLDDVCDYGEEEYLDLCPKCQKNLLEDLIDSHYTCYGSEKIISLMKYWGSKKEIIKGNV